MKDDPAAVSIAEDFYKEKYLDTVAEQGMEMSDVFQAVAARL